MQNTGINIAMQDKFGTNQAKILPPFALSIAGLNASWFRTGYRIKNRPIARLLAARASIKYHPAGK